MPQFSGHWYSGRAARLVFVEAALVGVALSISGHDALDSTSIPEVVPDYAAALDGNIRGLKIGLPKEYFISGLSKEVSDAVNAAVPTRLSRSTAYACRPAAQS